MEDALIRIEQVNLIPDIYKGVPVSELSSLGTIGSSLHQFVQSIARPGGEGIYKVTFPKGFEDMTLSQFHGEDAYMGSGVTDGSFKQARLKQLSADPTQVFVAMALISIQKKLNTIQETQQEILNFMFDVQETKLAGNLKVLNKTVEDYKYNCENESFIRQMLAQVGNIKREASQSEELYKKQIISIINTPESIHLVSKANDLMNKLCRDFRNYHLAFYTRSYTEFLEVFLMKNFTESNLQHLRERFTVEKNTYNEFYLRCYRWAEKYLNSAFGKKLAPFLRGFDELYAKGLSHVPGHLDRFYKADAYRYESAPIQLTRIKQDEECGITAFEESIAKMLLLKNESVELYVEDGKLYIADDMEVG